MSKAFYEKIKSTDIDNLPLETLDDDENNDDELVDCTKNTLQVGRPGKPKQRLKPRIIRSVWFNVKSHPEKHYRELIMLFTSWRNEETDLICSSSSYEERCLLLKEKMALIFTFFAMACATDIFSLHARGQSCRLPSLIIGLGGPLYRNSRVCNLYGLYFSSFRGLYNVFFHNQYLPGYLEPFTIIYNGQQSTSQTFDDLSHGTIYDLSST